jgi:hypothetical protein
MPRFTKTGLLGAELNGYDPDWDSQVLQVGKKTHIYLVDGDDADVQVQNDPSAGGGALLEVVETEAGKLSKAEAKQNLRKFTLTGKGVGAAELTAPMTAPFRVTVVKDAYARIFNGGNDPLVDSRMLQLIQGQGLRGAALRVAEDQMNSAMGRTGQGAGKYGLGADEKGRFYDWCGIFAQWCYQTAAKVIGEDNPFGNNAWTLASPQRAIDWAMKHPDLATVIHYAGSSPMDGSGKQEMNDVQMGSDGFPSNVLEGDICLWRNAAGGWQHVDLVHAITGDTFETIDGNVGYPSIQVLSGHKFNEKVAGGHYRFTFLNLSLPPIS